MWRLLSCFICSFLIILLWPSTSTFTYACDPGEIQCKTGIIFPTRWCCPNTTTCGTTKNECNQMTSRLPSSTSTSSPPSDTGFSIGPAIIGFVFIFIILAFFCYCLLLCVRKVISDQSRNTRTYTPPIPQSQYPRQQQFVQQPGHLQPRVPSVNRSAHTNAATPIYYNNEQLPPSYESVIRDTRFMYPAPSAPMRDVPLQESNFRL